jgi:hypothetical protein
MKKMEMSMKTIWKVQHNNQMICLQIGTAEAYLIWSWRTKQKALKQIKDCYQLEEVTHRMIVCQLKKERVLTLKEGIWKMIWLINRKRKKKMTLWWSRMRKRWTRRIKEEKEKTLIIKQLKAMLQWYFTGMRIRA